jgi:sialic acid synthase SpsE/sugar phosphate isomerase/epimerase
MYLDGNLEPFIVNQQLELADALKKLGANKILFVVDNQFRLVGSLTDGDFRRWIQEQSTLDLTVPVLSVCYKSVRFIEDSASERQMADMLSSAVTHLPVVDVEKRVVAIACFKAQDITIGSFNINAESRAFTIAEIGNNHNGSIELAKKLVDLAVDAGADCAKFQMRDLASLYSNAGDSNDDAEDLGSQYVLDLLSRFQLNDQEFYTVFDYCKEQGLAVLCTPFDVVSTDKLADYGVEAFKVASADLTNHDLLRHIASNNKPMIVSTGMATEAEIIDAVSVLSAVSAQYILLHCNSTYPAPFKDINLNYMERLAEIGGCLVGYSGHERGISIPMAAVANGAKVIEKHFTVDNTMEGNDHKVSLLPDEFKTMVQSIREIEEALGSSKPRTLSQGELMNRETLAKSVVTKTDINAGEIITAEMLDICSPGKGLSPYRKKELIGKKSCRDMKVGDFFFGSDIEQKQVKANKYSFKLPFGIPVRYHDVNTLGAMSNFDMLEFHLSYKDMDVDLSKYFDESKSYDIGFAVHAPELFTGDHTLDLCSHDEEYRKRSIKELQRVVDVARSLKKYFPKTERPVIVCNVGGYTNNGFLTESERTKCYALLAESLKQIDAEGVELIPQSMPPFPWHFGGQQYHNLFVSAEDIVKFCKDQNMRICLDVSHSKLACNYYNWDFVDFIERTAPYSPHHHIADADGSDGEGLQIGDGIIDFEIMNEQLSRLSPLSTWIPEIWQGHKNNGEGFWVALERLER